LCFVSDYVGVKSAFARKKLSSAITELISGGTLASDTKEENQSMIIPKEEGEPSLTNSLSKRRTLPPGKTYDYFGCGSAIPSALLLIYTSSIIFLLLY
jgi:hypothetical protein